MVPSTCLSRCMVFSPFRPQLQARDTVSCSRVMHVTRCSSSSDNKGSNPLAEDVPSISKQQSGDRSLASLFVFDGAAPETINGRMAMVGFVWALAAEKLTGLPVAEQLFNPSTSGLVWFSAVVQLFAFASIIPFANGQSADDRRWGLFNAKAERWNGRLAMIGFAALVLVEIVQQAPLIHI